MTSHPVGSYLLNSNHMHTLTYLLKGSMATCVGECSQGVHGAQERELEALSRQMKKTEEMLRQVSEGAVVPDSSFVPSMKYTNS